MTVSFESRTVIDAPAERVFDLSLDVDAHVQSQARSREQAVDGATVMIDHLEFDAPLGPIGRVVERIVLGTYLRKLIEERGTFLKRLAEQRS